MASPQPEGDLRDPTSPHSHPTYSLITSHLSPRWRPRQVQHHHLSDQVPPSCPPRAFPSNLSSVSSSSCHTLLPKIRKSAHSGSQLASFSTSSVYILPGINPHPGPVQDPCSVCDDRVHAGWVALVCMVCDQWCHRRCSGIYSPADYRRLAQWNCLTCSTPVPPAAPAREP